MQSNLYIPKKLKVGFQSRTDTFTGKLAYVIYYDDKGKLRKEKSWSSWRDETIDDIEIDNEPTDGFNLNKGFTRYSDWGSGRAVVRIWDPRDFEFEIGLDNLVGILMHSDVSKRYIEEKCVFAWNGTELVLLPCNTEEYKSSVEYTAKQAKTFSARTLVPGYTYTPKKESEPYIYLGRFATYTSEGRSYYHGTSSQIMKKDKKHWFVKVGGNTAETKDPSTFLASVFQEEVHQDFATQLENLHSTAKTQKIVGFKEFPFEWVSENSIYTPIKDNLYVMYNVRRGYYNDEIATISAGYVVELLNDGRATYDDYDLTNYQRSYYGARGNKRLSYSLDDAKKDGHVLPDILVKKPEGLSTDKVYYYYMNQEDKQKIDNAIAETIKEKFPNAVSLCWVLENGKTTKGLKYEY